jgi:3-oxoacyl-[acyl-carrier protein] reductase/pteridine reductase
MPEIKDRLVLVTGAAKRIGRAIALDLHAHGARVAIHYSGSEAAARKTAEECGNAPVFKANLESVAEIQRLFAEVEDTAGPLYGLVNNAARFTRFHPFDITEADWDFIHNVNLKATFFCCQQAAKRMVPRGEGRIVNMSSLGGIRPWSEHAHYCASKAGVIHMTRALAKAFGPQVTVNSVAPGAIPFGNDASDERVASMIRATPAQRGGTGEEIATAVRYFLEATNFVTGQILAVDGGLSQR